MPSHRNPNRVDFRRTQAADPSVSGKRRFGKWKEMKKGFDIYVTDIETGEETLALTVFAFTSRDAIGLARKKLHGSRLLRNITHPAYTAVEVEE